jgi:DNA recombination protein RmuC
VVRRLQTELEQRGRAAPPREDHLMTTSLLILASAAATIAAILTLLAFQRISRCASGPTQEQLCALMRGEADRLVQFGEAQSRALREELGAAVRGFQDSTLNVFRQLGDVLASRINEFGNRMNDGIDTIDTRAVAIGTTLEKGMIQMGEDAGRARDALRQTIESKLDDGALKHAAAAMESRQEVLANFQRLRGGVTETLGQLGVQQKERLENVTFALGKLTESQERAQDALRNSVEQRLDAIRNENADKLEEMRKTVDEKLQSTLEARLGESFNRVVEQLERVHKGIGEMQSLAAGVGDLTKMLSNVRVRGTFGELQLGALLEQFLSPEQFIKNAQVRENTQERVEFAIRLPGRDADGEVLLPVDAKFPQDDYERLLSAAEVGDTEMVSAASKALEAHIRSFAKTISDKYIAPPRTTEFAILFLPTESLYAEVLRRPGLFESIQRDYHVTLTGPTTFTALLNALQMGFRSLAIEKRSGEVWKILGAVRNQFGKYNEVVNRLARQLNTAAKSVESLGIRTRVMNQKLREVEALPDHTSEILLGTDACDASQDQFEEEPVKDSEVIQSSNA